MVSKEGHLFLNYELENGKGHGPYNHHSHGDYSRNQLPDKRVLPGNG
jgi:hypothetical protein